MNKRHLIWGGIAALVAIVVIWAIVYWSAATAPSMPTMPSPTPSSAPPSPVDQAAQDAAVAAAASQTPPVAPAVIPGSSTMTPIDNNPLDIWHCIGSSPYYTEVRSTDGVNPECLSSDGANCVWANDSTCASSAYQISNVKPLTCGAMHKSLYGKTGYDTPGHWCLAALSALGLPTPSS